MPTIKQLPSGTWRVAVKVNNQRRTATAPTKEAAKRLGAQMTVAMAAEPTRVPKTMRDLLLAHLDQQGYAPTKLADLRSVYKKFPEAFLDRKVQTVTPDVLDALYTKLLEVTTVHRVRTLHVLTSSALSRARRWGWINSNPARDAAPPAAPKREVLAPTTDQVRAFITHADEVSAEFGLLVRIAAVVGCRRGETCALQWRDIIGDSLIVRHSVSYTKASGMVVRQTKTGDKGDRRVAIPTALADRLAMHRFEQAERAAAAGVPIGADGWVFTSDFVSPWHPSSASHMAREARVAGGLLDKASRMKHLRNYVITEMLGEGYSLKQAGARAGHSKELTTQGYEAWMPVKDQAAAQMLGSRVL